MKPTSQKPEECPEPNFGNRLEELAGCESLGGYTALRDVSLGAGRCFLKEHGSTMADGYDAHVIGALDGYAREQTRERGIELFEAGLKTEKEAADPGNREMHAGLAEMYEEAGRRMRHAHELGLAREGDAETMLTCYAKAIGFYGDGLSCPGKATILLEEVRQMAGNNPEISRMLREPVDTEYDAFAVLRGCV
jgi:hypothetical protein